LYSQADRAGVQKQLRKRWMVSALPSGVLFVAAIVVFAICQSNRQDWGWVFACAATIVSGAYFLFFYGVYLRPMWLYARHVNYMLEGRMRETTGILTEVADEPTDKDGLDWYAIMVNIGDKGDPEDDRLLYYDALRGRPEIPLGTRVTVLSNDKMISEIRGV
jgi:hypothetical protein